MESSLPPSGRPALRSDLAVRAIDGDLVVYDPVDDRTILLNATAAATLELCDGSRTPAEISAAIRRVFPEEPRDIEGDVARALVELANHGLFDRG